MNFLRILLLCFLSGLTGLLILACSRTGEKKTKLAFVTNNASDFWTIARKGVAQADSELPNVDVEFRIPADGTAAEQRRIVDDLLATGGTAEATTKLAVQAGAEIAGLGFVVELDFLKGRDKLKEYDVFSLLRYDK